MDIKQLRYFVHIVEENSFSRAAKKLFVSQSTLSKSIKHLEEELGVEVLHVTGKRVQVTEYGQQLYGMAKEILDQHQAIYSTIHALSGLQTGVVQVGIPPIIGTCVFPGLIAGFLEQYPGIEIVIDQHGANHVQRLVDSGELDVAFTIMPTISDAFDVFPIVQDENVVIVSKHHPLAQRDAVAYSELRSEKFVLLGDEYMLYNNIIAGCRGAGFEPRIVVKASQWDFIIQLVKLGMGISILPRRILVMYPEEEIAMIRLAHQSSQWNVAMITRKDRYAPLAVKTFLDYINRHAHTAGK